MRLRTVYRVLDAYKDVFKLQAKSVGSQQKVINIQPILRAAKAFDEAGILSGPINELKSLPDIYNNLSAEILVDNDIWSRLASINSDLSTQHSLLLSAITKVLPPESDNALEIKLPPKNDLTDVASALSKLEKAMSQSISHDLLRADLKVESFDNGSLWVTVVVSTGIAMQFIASLVWSAAIIRKKILEGNLLNTHVRSLEIKNTMFEEIEQAQKKQLQLLIESEAKQLEASVNIENDPEYRQRLMFSIRELAELLIEGSEVHPALSAPEEVKNLLPDFKNLDFIQSKIREICYSGDTGKSEN